MLTTISKIYLLTMLLFCLAGAERATSRPGAWGELAYGCRIAVKLPKAEYSVGEPINVGVICKNFGNDLVDTDRIHNFPYADFDVEATLADNPVALTAYSQRKISNVIGVIHISLKPGEEMNKGILISRLLDLSEVGEYHIKLHFKFTQVAGNIGKQRRCDSTELIVKISEPEFVVPEAAHLQGKKDRE